MKDIRYCKKSGSLVIEAAVSVMILSMTAVFIVNAYIDCSKSIKSRILNEDVTRNIKNIEREIQYNLSREEIHSLFIDNKRGLKYDEGFGREILNKNLSEIDEGEDIVIRLTGEDEEGMKFKIKADIIQNGVHVEADDEFEKSWWIDEN